MFDQSKTLLCFHWFIHLQASHQRWLPAAEARVLGLSETVLRPGECGSSNNHAERKSQNNYINAAWQSKRTAGKVAQGTTPSQNMLNTPCPAKASQK